MKYKRYNDLETFRTDVLPVLLEDEARNNLSISIVSGDAPGDLKNRFMGTISDSYGKVLLVALCTKPFNIMLCPAPDISSAQSDDALWLLSEKLNTSGFRLPGVFATTEIAKVFSGIYTGNTDGTSKRRMILMKLDEFAVFKKASGYYRQLTEDDLSFVPAWEQAFNIDCKLPPVSFEDNEARIKTRLGRDLHYLWIDGAPVSQAVFGRETPNSGVITWVYTPPEYRGRGYATSVTGELTNSLLSRGKKFCCLFADADNQVSRGMYSKLGYYDVTEFTEITF